MKKKRRIKNKKLKKRKEEKVMNRRKTLLTAVVLLLVILIGVMLAYFTDTEEATNKFTIGNVNITLSEPNWSTTDTNEDCIPDAATAKTPGQVVSKDPKITLDAGSNNAYLFMKVKVPAITTSTGSGENITYSASKELYTYSVDSSWGEVIACKTIGNGYVEHVYVYGSNSTPTVVSAGTTTTNVFPSVTVNTDLTNDEVTANFAAANAANIVVTGYGIQA